MLFDGSWHMGPWGLFWGLIGLFMNLLVLALVVWLVVALVRSSGRGPRRTPQEPHALAVLEERYARGEISRDEFFERRAVLLGEERHGGA